MCGDDAGGLIEGVGNEVLFTVPVVAAVVVGLLGFAGWQQLRQLSSPSPQPAASLTSPRLNNGAALPARDSMAAHYGSDAQCPICLAEPRHPVETNCGHLFCANCLVSYWHHGNWRGAVRCPVCRQQVSVMLRCFQDQHVADETDAQREERARLLRDINDYNRRYSGEPRPSSQVCERQEQAGEIDGLAMLNVPWWSPLPGEEDIEAFCPAAYRCLVYIGTQSSQNILQWLDHLRDLPTLLRHAGSEFFSVGGIMYMFRLRIVLCFVAAVMYLISPLDMIPEAIFGILGLLDDLFVVLLLAIYVTVIYRRFLAARWQEDTT